MGFTAEAPRTPRATEENPEWAGAARPGAALARRSFLAGRRLGAERLFGPAGQRGLTLIELMVALSIFAVLGLLAYRALAAATLGEARLAAGTQRWQALARSLRVIDGELLEAVTASGSAAAGTPAMQLLPAGPDGPGEFRFLRLDPTRGVRRVGFRLREQRLEWLRWEDRDSTGAPAVTPLLEAVQGLRWRFIQNGTRLDLWPAGNLQNNRLPAAVVVEIELPDLGRFERVFALR